MMNCDVLFDSCGFSSKNDLPSWMKEEQVENCGSMACDYYHSARSFFATLFHLGH